MNIYIILRALINLTDENLFTEHTGVATTRKTSKLSDICETESTSMSNPIGSENIYILYFVDKFIRVNCVDAFLNKKCKKCSRPSMISKQGLERIFIKLSTVYNLHLYGCVMLFISECSGVRETGTVNGLTKHKRMQAETCLFETLSLGRQE